MTHGAAVHSRARNCSVRPPSLRFSSSRTSLQNTIIHRADFGESPYRIPKPQNQLKLIQGYFHFMDN